MKVWQRKTDDDEHLAKAPGKRLDPLTPVAWGVLLLLGGVCAAVHLALYNRFGFHLDELYFMECARHMAYGYVDHPPLVPWIAGLGMKLFGENLFAVRFFPALAAATAVVLTGLIAREFGGGRYAQGVAGLAVFMAPGYLRSGSLLCIPIFELVFWTGLSYCVVRALRAGDSRWWIAAGMTAGLGLLTKYAMVIWGAGVAAGVLLTPARRRLLSPWPWVGAALAGCMFFPHLAWEAAQGWPSVEFLQNLRAEILEVHSRPLFLLMQVINMLFLLAPIWGMGLWFLFSAAGARFRTFGWAFVLVFAFFFLERGKPYYLAPAYTVLFAGGGVQLERILSRCPNAAAYRRILVGAVVIVGSANALFALPIIPLETSDRIVGSFFGHLLDPRELTREFHAQYGWEVYAEQVDQAYRGLRPEEQQVCTILALSYAQASAINFFGKPYGLPRAVSGHMNYYLWGPVPGRGEVAIVCGFPLDMLEPLYGDVREVGRTFHPLARQEYNNVPIHVCRDPKVDLTEAWGRFKRYYHTAREWRDKPADR